MFRISPLFEPLETVPLNIAIGRNEERKKAGYIPANKPMEMAPPTTIDQKNHDVNGICNSTPAILLNDGIAICARNIAITEPIRDIRIDSDKNNRTRCIRYDPNTLRIPTSFARSADLAVDRFMKFTQARIRINNAMAEKM